MDRAVWMAPRIVNVAASSEQIIQDMTDTTVLQSSTWTTGAGSLSLNSTDPNINGVARLLNPSRLKNGSILEFPSLLTVPQYVANGWISVKFPAVTIQSGDRFKTTYACQYDTISCNAGFLLQYQEGANSPVYISTFYRSDQNPDATATNIDLSYLAGKSVNIILKTVNDGTLYAPNRALWIYPRIVRP